MPSPGNPHGAPPGYASQRLANAIAAGSLSTADPKTLADWGRAIGVSAATIRAWCYTAHERPKRVLDLVRVLRALTAWQGARWDPFEAFDVASRRTLVSLFRRGNAEFLLTSEITPVRETFLRSQQYLSNAAVVEAVLAGLPAKGRPTHA